MKECFYRAVRTFLQTAFGYLTVNIAIVDFSNDKEQLKSILIGLLISSVSAGLAGIMNYTKEGRANENE